MEILQTIQKWAVFTFPIVIIIEIICYSALRKKGGADILFWENQKYLDMAIFRDHFWKILLLQILISIWSLLELKGFSGMGSGKTGAIVVVLYVLGLSFAIRSAKAFSHNETLNSDG